MRPEDITAANTIRHTQIAEARVTYGGRGEVSRVQKVPAGQALLEQFTPSGPREPGPVVAALVTRGPRGARPGDAAMRLGYWVICCLGAAAAAFAGCSYNRDHAGLSLIGPQKGFFLSEEGGAAKLAYGVADSDDVGLMLECAKGSGTVQVSDQSRSNPAPQLILASERRPFELEAEGRARRIRLDRRPPAPRWPPRPWSASASPARSRSAVRARRTACRPAERAVVDRFFAACEAAGLWSG